MTSTNSVQQQRYKTGKLIGNGGFGQIYTGVDTLTNRPVAIKFERIQNNVPQLLPYESRIYKKLRDVKGIPNMHYFGVKNGFNVMVLDLLGDNLSTKVHAAKNKRFSMGCVCLLADKILGVLARFHRCGFVHRDIKPSNIVLARDNGVGVYLLDFGLSKCFWDAGTQKHIAFCTGKSWLGTARYSSVASHLGYESSRKDDLESLGYVLVALACGALPWDAECRIKKQPPQHAQAQAHPSLNKKRRALNAILIKKQETIAKRTLCKQLHPVFQNYFDYVHSLNFDQTPDYVYLRLLFRNACKNSSIVPCFDWVHA